MGLENPLHILILALVIVLIFGAKRVPEIGRKLGKGVRDVKSSVGLDEIVSTPKQIREAIAAPAPTATASAEKAPADAVEPEPTAR